MNQLKRLTLIGIIFVIISGTIWHFVYEWSGNSRIAGLFFPVNESTWEHMKLCFFPMLLYSFYMNKKLKKTCPCITSALLTGILSGTFSIPVIFYTCTGILGYHCLILDMGVFIASILIAFYTVYRLTLSCRLKTRQNILILLTAILGVCFLLFTYFPPNIGIFANPSGYFSFPLHSFPSVLIR